MKIMPQDEIDVLPSATEVDGVISEVAGDEVNTAVPMPWDEINEGAEDGKVLIVEDSFFIPESVVDILNEADGTPTGRKLVRGKVQQEGEKNRNRRLYTTDLWNKVLGDPAVQWRLKNKMMFGELDHPADGRTSLGRVSHILTKLGRGKDGAIMAEAVVLNTSRGRELSAILEETDMIGASSRGFGKLKKDGETVDEQTFDFKTVDFVAEPSTRGAYVVPVGEAVEPGTGVTPTGESVEPARLEEIRDLVSGIESHLSDGLSESKRLDIVATLAELSSELTTDSDSREIQEAISRVLIEVRHPTKQSVDDDRSKSMEPTNAQVAESIDELKDRIEASVKSTGDQDEMASRLGLAEEVIDDLTQRFTELTDVHEAMKAEKEQLLAELNQKIVAAEELIDEFLRRNEESAAQNEESDGRQTAAEEVIEAQQTKIGEMEESLADISRYAEAAEKLLQDKLDEEDKAGINVYIAELVDGLPQADLLAEELADSITKEQVDERYERLRKFTSDIPKGGRLPLPESVNSKIETKSDGGNEQLEEDSTHAGGPLATVKAILKKDNLK